MNNEPNNSVTNVQPNSLKKAKMLIEQRLEADVSDTVCPDACRHYLINWFKMHHADDFIWMQVLSSPRTLTLRLLICTHSASRLLIDGAVQSVHSHSKCWIHICNTLKGVISSRCSTSLFVFFFFSHTTSGSNYDHTDITICFTVLSSILTPQ